MDWLSNLLEEDSSLLGDTLRLLVDADQDEYLQTDECAAALAAAEIVAAACSRGTDRIPQKAAAWIQTHEGVVSATDRVLAQRAAERVIAKSELRQLWDETGSTEWHHDVHELLRRLANRKVTTLNRLP